MLAEGAESDNARVMRVGVVGLNARVQRKILPGITASPRIVYARVVGSSGGTKVSGPTLQSRLGLMSTWDRFKRVRGQVKNTESVEPPPGGALGAGAAPIRSQPSPHG